ncbi:MAG: alpha/beta hydrolase [Opitutae bacterium]|nr:alpha/beta hydrolase [Opitutae bacterium]
MKKLSFYPFVFPMLAFLVSLGANAKSETLFLWPDKVPGEVPGEVGKEKGETRGGILRISNVSKPSLTVFPASPKNANGTSVLVCPGGGYSILAYEHEGSAICEWLNSLGVTGFLLKYRVPRRKNLPKHEAPLQDAQRAIGLIRQNAKKWKVDPDRLGILGFSAGGNLSVMALTSHQSRTYPKVDGADEFSCRPSFGILIYPAYLVDRKKRDKLFPEIKITKETPPCFFAHTGDDGVPAEGSVLMYLELEKLGVKGNELHVYPFGGHGYGMRPSDHPVVTWPARAGAWMKAMGWLKK